MKLLFLWVGRTRDRAPKRATVSSTGASRLVVASAAGVGGRSACRFAALGRARLGASLLIGTPLCWPFPTSLESKHRNNHCGCKPFRFERGVTVEASLNCRKWYPLQGCADADVVRVNLERIDEAGQTGLRKWLVVFPLNPSVLRGRPNRRIRSSVNIVSVSLVANATRFGLRILIA
jgi:hypothetical protein